MVSEVDLITLEVVQEYLISTVREMGVAMVRTAHSSIIYEAHDFSCALLTGDAQLIAQSEGSPGHTIPLPWQVREAVEFFKDDINPGDIILVNDAYSSGTHLNDVAMIIPYYAEQRRLAFVVVRAHWGDVGGMTPGSLSGQATEVFQEGLRIPFVKVYERGQRVGGILDIIFSNVRVPEEREGDFHAMLACCHTAELRLNELVGRLGVDQVSTIMDELLRRAEKRMRDRLRALPDGTYHFEDYLDSDNLGAPVPLRVRIDVKDGILHADFAGSAPQVRSPLNCSLAATSMGTFIAVKALLDPYAPINHGVFRPITVDAPLNTVVNARYPVAVGGFSEMRRRVESTVMGALARVAREYAAGDVKGTANHTYIGSVHPRHGGTTIFYEYPAGGTGGFLEHDGSHAMRGWDEGDFTSIQPAEVLEFEHPLLVERCELRIDSCGDGRRRGGLGLSRELRLLSTEGTFSVLSDRNMIPPFGVCGGHAAAPNRFRVRRGNEVIEPSHLPGKISGFPLRKGDIVFVETAGGGGFEAPLDRAIEDIAEDLRLGYITQRHAEQHYGVVMHGNAIDATATRDRREKIKAAQRRLTIRTTEKDDLLPDRRICKISPKDAATIGASDGSLVELVNPLGAPLRAWISIVEGIDEGFLDLGPIGRSCLGMNAGDTVELRKLRDTQAA